MTPRRLLALLAASSALFLCCAEVEELPPDELCREAGFSIANRTLACTSDQKLSNARYERLRADYTCKAVKAASSEDKQISCALDLMARTCDQVNAAADDLDRWLRETPSCRPLFERKDGRSLDPPDPCLPLLSCDGVCVDINTDFNNCGGCGLRCPSITRACVDRECQLY